MAKRDKPVVSFTLEDDLIKRIEDFQFENRIGSRSKALAELIEMALDIWEQEKADMNLEEAESVFDPINEMDRLKLILDDMQKKMIKHRKDGSK